MRFFSNEAKENADDREAADNDTDRERADNDGVAVPQQRIGSPWSDAPGSDTAAVPVEPQAVDDRAEVRDADPDLRDESLREDDSEVRHDGDDLVRDDDSPRHDDPLDLPLDDQDGSDNHAGSHRADGSEATDTLDTPERVDSDRLDSDGVDSDPVDSDRAEDGVDSDRVEDGVDSDRVEDGVDSDRVASDRVDPEDADTVLVDSDPGAEQRGGTTTTYGPDGSVTTVDDSSASTSADERSDVDEAAPVVATAPVSTTADEASETESLDDAAAAPAVPVGAADAATATPTGAKPDPSASPVGDKLFTDGDSFNDRLRDIALNFVDNPKEATEQAGALVDEAIEKVTSALKSQKDGLAGDGDDTEKYRVELRGYRDILKRISSL